MSARPALGIAAWWSMASLLSACAVADSQLPVTTACLVSETQRVPIKVEVAREPEDRRQGLMGRSTLEPDSGMLFVYREPRQPNHGFWMYRTLIPLDIAYIRRDGTIGAIRQMFPCPAEKTSECPSYSAGVQFTYALEMNLGFFSDHNIRAGDRLGLTQGACSTDQ